MIDKMTAPRLNQVSTVVDDVEATAAYLTDSLGIGPWRIFENRNAVMVFGKPTTARRKVATTMVGEGEVELVQAELGTPHYEFMRRRGKGLNHVRIAAVDDLDGTVAYLEKNGFKVVYSGIGTQGNFAYMESDQLKGFVLELAQARKS